MNHRKNNFSENKIIELSHFLVWLDLVTNDFNAYCERDEVLKLIKIVESLRDSYLKYKKGKRKLLCGSPTSNQLEGLNNDFNISPRKWVYTIDLRLDPDQQRSMQFEKEVLTISANLNDINDMLDSLDGYYHRRTHAFSIFSVPRRISNRRTSSTDFYFWYNLEGMD